MQTETNDLRYYLGLLKTRKIYFIIPALIIFLVASAVALLLPTVYESSSTILIEEQQIPPEFVRSTVTGFADQRIQSLTQQILSRTKLWEIIQQFNLYPELRAKNTREEIIDEMRENISFTTISAEQKGGGKGVTIAFKVAYRGKNPETIQKVAGTLASLYLEQNLKMREAQARSTTTFLEAELKELDDRIRTLGEKITAFKEQNEGLLPEQQPFNMRQAESLEGEIKQLDIKIRGSEELKTILGGQLEAAELNASALNARTPNEPVDPRSRLKALKLVLADLRSKYSEDHPDIRKTLREIDELKKIVGDKGTSSKAQGEKLAQLKAELAEKQGKYSDNHPDIRKLKNEIAALEKDQQDASSASNKEDQSSTDINFNARVQAANTEIEADKRQQASIREQLKMYRKRLENAPKMEEEYMALLRDYQNDSQKHQEVMNKILESRISEGMEEHQKAEKFTLIDPASAGKAVSPPRPTIFLVGIVLSFGGGFGTVALVEHLDQSVKTADELSRLTNFPVLGSIPRILTSEDVTREARRKRLICMVTAFSVIVGLILFNFFVRNLLVLAGRLWRLV